MAKTKPKSKGKGKLASKMTSQVKAETSLRYDPQTTELKRTLGDLRGELTTDVSRAHAGAEGIKLAAKQAKPQLVKTYGEGTAVADRAQSDLATKLGAIPGGGSLVSGVAARDAEGTKRRLGEAQSMATAELTKRASDAASGEALQVANLTGRYASDASKVRGRLDEIAKEKGTYASARSGEISADAAKTANSNAQAAKGRRNARVVAGVDASGKVIPGGAKDKPAKAKSNEKAKKSTAAFTDELAKAKAAVAPYVGKLPRPKIAALLSGGASVPAKPEQVDTAKLDSLIAANPPTGQPGHLSEGELRRRATVPGKPAVTVKAIGSSAALSAALDLLLDKHLSPATIAKLREKYPGIRIKKTGLPTRATAPKSKPTDYAGGAAAGSGIAR